jgi:hypothetical protein
MSPREEIARAISETCGESRSKPEWWLSSADAVIAALSTPEAVTRVARALWLHGSEGLDPDLDPGGTEENMPMASDAIHALLRGGE